MTNPKEPTLTCSEVAERLAAEFVREHFGKYVLRKTLSVKQAAQMLVEWRERRVQELEEALRQARGKLLIMADSPFWVKTIGREEISKELHLIADEIKNTLANSEQIRKGAKHE